MATVTHEYGLWINGESAEADERDVYALVERSIMSVGAHFVPIKHAGVIYIRPPLS